MARLFEGALKNWKFVLGFLGFSFLFWFLEFALQYYFLAPGEFGSALVRSFGLSGATFIGLALFSSCVFRFYPKLARYWYVRRSLGVMGFVFVLLHFRSVIVFIFKEDFSALLYPVNPFEKPLVFGFVAFLVFFLLAITSTDWAVQKLGPKNWKAVHRLVYFGYLLAVFHFLLINPQALFNPAGFFLLFVTFLALAGELYWFVKTISKSGAKKTGTLIGFLLVFLYLVFAFLAFVAPLFFR